MLKIANLHWQQNINLIILKLYFVQSFQGDLEAIYLKEHITLKTLRNGHSVDFI